MSGIDEQDGIPVCPMCESIPAFWVLYADEDGKAINGWYWLNSSVYLEKHPSDDKLICMPSHHGFLPILDDIKCICHSAGSELHKFTSEHVTFQKIMRVARRSKIERN